MSTALGDSPYLKSCSIYDFDLDTKILTISDYDCLSPRDTQRLPLAEYPIKQISKASLSVPVGRVHNVDPNASTMDEALRHGELEKTAKLIVRDGQVLLVVSADGLECSPRRPIMLSLRYSTRLTGKGNGLIYSGAIQPSDYSEFNRNFGHLIDASRVTKEIVVTSRSQHPYTARYFDASSPIAFPQVKVVDKDSKNKYFEDRWTFTVSPGNATRAFYFAVATETVSELPPQPIEVLDEQNDSK